MSSADPSEKNEHVWSTLKNYSHGQDPRPQMQQSPASITMSAMHVDRDQPLGQPVLQQQQAMYVNRDQPLQQYQLQQQQAMYVNRDQPLQQYPLQQQHSMYVNRDQPLSRLSPVRLPLSMNRQPLPGLPQQPTDSPQSAIFPQSTFVQPPFTSGTSASQKLEFGQPEKIIQRLSEVYRWKFTFPIVKPGTSTRELRPTMVMVFPDKPTKQLIVDIEGFEPGWYWIVLLVGRSQNLTQQDLESLVIDVKQLDVNGKEMFASKTCRTIFTDYDKAAFFAPNRDFESRIRLHRQIEINHGNYLQLTIDAKLGAYAILQFASMEIVRGQPDPEDIVIYGEGGPHDVIHIPQHVHHGRAPKTTNVHVCCVSDSRAHAVTLSFDDGNAYIHLWELEPPSAIDRDGVVPSTPPHTREEKARHPQNHRVPVAHFVFNAKAANHAEVKDICLAISSDGLQIVIHSVEPDNGHGISFRLFQYTSLKTIAIDDANNLCHLKEVTNFKSNSGLKNFFGYGDFNTQGEDNSSVLSSTSKERYITCQGTEISMYSTTGERWERLFTLLLCLEPNLDAALRLHMSLGSRYFAWTGSKDVVSIWDLETGRQISHIATASEDDAEIFVNFSRSGKKVAISVSGKIKIHQTHSGVLLGEYTQGLDEDSFYHVDFDEDYFMVMDQTASTEAKEEKVAVASCRHVVDTREEINIVKTYWIHQDYRLMTHSGIQKPLYGCGQGSVFNLMTMPDPIAPAPAYDWHQNCSLRVLAVDQYIGVVSHGFTSTSGDSFRVSSAQRAIRGIWSTVLEISRSTDRSKSVVIPLGPAISSYSGLFLAESSHLVLIVGCFLQRWKLLATGPEICELDLVWKIQDDSKHLKDICVREIIGARVCQQGQELVFYLAGPQWYRRHRRVKDENDGGEEGGGSGKNAAKPTSAASTGLNFDTVTVPYEERDTMPLPLVERELQGVVGAVTLYVDGDQTLKRYVIRYLKSLVRQTQERDLSCIVSLARVWTPDRRASVEGILAELLSPKRISWVPDTFATKQNDPLSILMSIAQRQPSAIGASRVMLDYCVSHAIESRNLSFLSPLFLSFQELMNLYPEEASEYLSKIAFIPAQQRSFIIDNHQVVRPPVLFRIPFWKTNSVPLYQVEDPILQLVVTPPKEKDPANDTFTRPVFMTTFDALWTYLDRKSESRKKASSGLASLDSPSSILKAMTVYSPQTNEPVSSASLEDYWAKKERTQRQGSSWIRTGLHMIRHKAQFRSKVFVRSHDFNLEFFDNPAIAALVAYKWNTIGYSYWLFRFMSQCVFYALIYFAALFQVYDRANPNPPIAQYIAILVLGSIFLWLEMLQAIQNWHRYKRSRYNFLDLIAYGLPIISSIDQIIINRTGDPQGNTRILSFTVLVIFVHMLFEARVQEGICKYVTIIQEAVLEIKAFLVIFAAGLLGFAVAILHLLHGRCPMGGCLKNQIDVQDNNSTFPFNFLNAVSSTYFFMGGIYDPLSENFKDTDWAFHLMMAMYFFFTVILMLNVLIALINVAFIKGGDGWRLVWIESRLQYIEAAENMSYHIPGFRDAHDIYFPKVIYFTATWKQVKDYKEKYREENVALDRRL
ncbi:hypothetical protein BGZ83_008748 [Gryganskiella cystojenkinii]|nr:hypothetical protein BGZ83_008748 [Gryganskiella cystojenkinii]